LARWQAFARRPEKEERVRKVLLCLVVIVAMGLVLTPMLSSAGPPPGSPPCDKSGPMQNNKNCGDDGGNRCQHGKQPKKGCPTDGGDGDGAATCESADLAIPVGEGALLCLYAPGNGADVDAECPGGVVLGDGDSGALALLCNLA
jgi:hypothetical protein